MRKPLWAQAGDTFFTHSDTLLGGLIRWGETEKGEEPAWTNHMGKVVESGWIIPPDDAEEHLARIIKWQRAVVAEALWHFRIGPLDVSNVEVRVFRPKPAYSAAELTRLRAAAQSYVGEKYGWWKLLGFLAKKITGINFPLLFFVKNRPICSFAAALLDNEARPIGPLPNALLYWPGYGMPPQAVDPDEALDFCLANPQFWEEVQ